MSDDEDEKRRLRPAMFLRGTCSAIRPVVSHGQFIDPKEGAIEKRQFSAAAPKWRHVGRGVNLEGSPECYHNSGSSRILTFIGHCENTACVSHLKGRIIHQWGKRNFDFFADEHLCACPVCHKYVQPISCGFYDTRWKISGIKKAGRGSPPEKVPSQWHTAAKEDGYITFDDNLTEQVEWKELLIEVR
jgi:hypothetical protein